MKFPLLCKFSTNDTLNDDLEALCEFELAFNNAFVFSNVEDTQQMFITFNIKNTYTPKKNYISIHRKPLTNTLYTINAMNMIIHNMNGGVIDPTIRVPWHEYKNSLIFISQNNLNVIELHLERVFKIN